MMRYPETVQAPTSARKLPHMARPCSTWLSSAQRSPPSQVQASDKPITAPPRIAINSPSAARQLRRSSNSRGESSATHNGPVDTKTTELATEVYSSDEIQVP